MIQPMLIHFNWSQRYPSSLITHWLNSGSIHHTRKESMLDPTTWNAVGQYSRPDTRISKLESLMVSTSLATLVASSILSAFSTFSSLLGSHLKIMSSISHALNHNIEIQDSQNTEIHQEHLKVQGMDDLLLVSLPSQFPFKTGLQVFTQTRETGNRGAHSPLRSPPWRPPSAWW